MNYDERQADTWNQIRDLLESLSQTRGWIFRGQRCASWGLKTSLERHVPRGRSLDAAESTLLSEFKRRAHTYLSQQLIPDEKDDGEWLALMQHFGAPTRLLDATKSPYVAAYFAVEDESREPHCAIWAFNQSWCYEAAGTAILAVAEEKDRKAIEALHEQISRSAPTGTQVPSLARLQGVASSGLRTGRWRPKQIQAVVPYTPNRLSERLSVQQGTFLVPRDVTRPFMDNLANMANLRQGVIKISIPADAATRGTILERLRAMNIQRASLFPGIEGYAQSFRTLLLEEPSESRAERQAMDAIDRAVPPGKPEET